MYKEAIVEILKNHGYKLETGLWSSISDFVSSDPLSALLSFTKKLPPGKLSSEHLKTLKELVASRRDLDKNTKEAFDAIHDKLIQEETPSYLLWELFNMICPYDWAHMIVDACEELAGPFTSDQKQLAKFAIAGLYMAYHAHFTPTHFVMSASRLMEQIIQEGSLPASYFKCILAWSMGLGLQLGSDVYMERVSFLPYYLVGSVFDGLSNLLFNAIKKLPRFENYATQYPKNTLLARRIFNRIGFSLGGRLGQHLFGQTNFVVEQTEAEHAQVLNSKTELAANEPALHPELVTEESALPPIPNRIDPRCVPEGSYKKSCVITAAIPVIEDKSVLCVVDLACEKLDKTSEKVSYTYPKLFWDGCFHEVENCDGKLYFSSGNSESLCEGKAETTIKKIADEIINNRTKACDPSILQGSFKETCTTQLASPKYSNLTRINGFFPDSVCSYQTKCDRIEVGNEDRITTITISKDLHSCAQCAENGDGYVIPRDCSSGGNNPDWQLHRQKQRDIKNRVKELETEHAELMESLIYSPKHYG